MKTLKNIFTNKDNKSINSFTQKLDFNAMLMVKGGDGSGDGDLWPPTTGTGTEDDE